MLTTNNHAQDPTINVEDVNYAILKLSAYNDQYSTGIVKVFTDYLEHQDFQRMRDELETVPHLIAPSFKIWDINANIGLLEVIYPSEPKGGNSCA